MPFLAPPGLVGLAAGRAVHAQGYQDNGYQEVKAPQILDKTLWEKTDHWDKYRENMFTTDSEKREYTLQADVNCGHIIIFKQGIKTTATCHCALVELATAATSPLVRYGIMRVRAFTWVAAIFYVLKIRFRLVTAFTALLQKVYADFSFTQHPVYVDSP